MIKNTMGHGPVCYIPKFMEIETLVPRDKMLKAFQNIWTWKPSVHVTNIFISSYLKKTRTVRGSDYSPAIELSEQKGKLVTATGDTEKYSEKQAKSG